jgi:hypothetical protein
LVGMHARAKHEARGGNTDVLGFKLMYDHIPVEHRLAFARFIECEGIVVVHLVRSASVNSFWTLQVEMQDMLQLGNTRIHTHTHTHTHL